MDESMAALSCDAARFAALCVPHWQCAWWACLSPFARTVGAELRNLTLIPGR
jgi:hypothetical protein